MKIQMINTKNVAGEIFSAGSFYDLSEGQAKTWIGSGDAKTVEKTSKKGKEAEK